MTDGSGDWTYRGRYGAGDYDAGDFGPDDYGAGDSRPDDDFYSGPYPGAGRAERPGYDPDGVPSGWSGEFERPGYGRSGPTERPGDPYHQPRPGDSGHYGLPGGYDDEPGGYRRSPGYGDSSGYGDAGGFGAASSHDRHGQPSNDDGLDGYRTGPDGQDSHAAGLPYHDPAYPADDSFGQAGYGATGSFGRYGHDPYGERPHSERPYDDHDSYQPDADRTSAAEWPGPHSASDSPPSRSFGLADSGSFGRADSGSFGRADTGSFGRADTGSFGRADSGSFGRADTGSFGRADSGSFNGADTGSFARGDSGSFGRPGAGPFGRDETTRGLNLPSSRGALPAGSDGYGQWHSDTTEHGGWDQEGGHQDADDDWGDDEADADGGPVFGFLRRGGQDDDDGGRGGRRPRRLRGRLAMVAAILVGALVLGMVADFGYEYVHSYITGRYGDYSGPGYGTVRVTVPQGSSLTELGPALLRAGVIKSLRPYDSAANAATKAASLQPGVYMLHSHMNAALAVAALLNPKSRARDQITIIEGWRASEIAAVLAKQTGHPASEFTNIIDHPPASLGLPRWASAGRSAEGFLFPDTYTLLPSMTPLQILQMMVKDFNQRVTKLHLAAVAKQKFTTPYHVLIVASLVQAEAGSVGDFPKISRVIWDRLKIGMKLQFDSTVFYAMGKYGTAITKAQESYPSPYNTYAHAGLPPGPIGSPGVLALEAALHPTENQTWLYFITDTRHKPYVTKFTSSFATFQQWQREIQG